MSIKVVVADDQEIVRRGIERLFEDEDIDIIAEASNGQEALTRTVRKKPDVLLMDVMMPGVDGLDTLEKLRKQAPHVKVVMMSAFENPTYVARAIALGADGFIQKDASPEEFVAADKRANRGEPMPTEGKLNDIKQLLAKRLDPEAHDVPLTKREYQVLRHLAYGLSNREIAKSLEISIETVKEHVQNILRKLDAADRTEAAVWAVKRGLA